MGRIAAAVLIAVCMVGGAAAQTATARGPEPALRGAAKSEPERRAADLSAGAKPAAADQTINYGKPRKRPKTPKPFPARLGFRPALPPLEPYKTSPQGRALLKQKAAAPAAPDPDLPIVAPPPTVATVPTLPTKPRPRIDGGPFAPVGIGIGNLRLFPFVESGLGFDTNPNRVASPKTGSAFWRGDAGASVQSDWSRHSLVGSVRFGYSDFFSVPQANRPDGVGAVAGRIDVTRDAAIDVGGAFALDTLRPSSPELIGLGTAASTNRPLVSTFGGFLGGAQRFNRLDVSLRGTLDRSQYGDATFSDGTRQRLSQNNFTTLGVRPRVSYEVSPALRPFAEVVADKRLYDNTLDVNGFRRSSTGVTARAGATFELTPLIRGEASAGFVARDYEDPRLAPLRGPLVDAALIWTATPLTTVTLRASTTVNETTLPGVSGALTRRVTGEIAHALLRNVTLVGVAAFQATDYRGVDLATAPEGVIRERFATAGIRAEYNLTRTVVVKASYGFERLRSTFTGSDYTANVFLLGLRLQR